MSPPSIPQMEPWFDAKEAAALAEYVNSGGWLTEFRKTAELERAIADFVGAKHCVMVTSASAALTLALMAVPVESGAEVIVPNLTMIATANAATLFGARPVFVDVDAKSLCMSAQAVEAALTDNTRAVVFVSFNGRAGELRAIRALCEERGLVLVEDAAQSLGSLHEGKHLGTFGKLGCFSFSAAKIISTGQGGAVVTDDADIAERVRRLKDFGRLGGGHDNHESIGFNFKFTDLQAVVGLEQMKKLPARVTRKKAIYARYAQQLADLPGVELLPTNLDEVTPWFIDIFADRRDELAAHLSDSGVGCRPCYPPIHSQQAYRAAGSFPVTEHFAARGLWLPSSARLTDEEVDRTCGAVRAFFRR